MAHQDYYDYFDDEEDDPNFEQGDPVCPICGLPTNFLGCSDEKGCLEEELSSINEGRRAPLWGARDRRGKQT